MATLTLKLLGAVVVELSGRPLRFSRRAGLALLIYLACSGRSQARATLATLIAGESDEPQAAMAVSNALRDLRAELGDDLQADKQTVTLAPTLTIALDVADFEAAAHLALQRDDLEALRAAAVAYSGEFARGFHLRDAPAFDDWLHYERALAAAIRREDRQGELATRSLLARLAWRHGDLALMRATVAAAWQRFDDREPSLDLILLWYAEAHLAVEVGDLTSARTLLERRSVRSQAPEHFQLRFWHWSLQIAVATAEGRLAAAEEQMRHAAGYAGETVHGFISVHLTAMLGDALLAQGALEEADATYVQALEVATRLNMPRPRCVALLGRAHAAELRGDAARAHALASEGLQIASDEGYQRLQRKAHLLLGRGLAGLGRYAEAAAAFAQARAADEAVGHSVQAAEAAAAEAQALYLHGDPAAARRRLEPCLPLLLSGQLIGAEEPVRALRAAAEVLGAADDPRGAQLHARAHSELEWRAALVRPERRAAFLYAIPAHRGLLSAAELVAG